MSLTIYNSLTSRKEPFTPIEPGRVRMYVCGMTVYDYCHLGHARVLVAFDVITRYLRAVGYAVDYVRNITDVDDKIIQRAVERGLAFDELTRQFIEFMHEDEARLGVLPPDQEPRATAHMAQIVAMIQALIDRGHAYQAGNGDVYYAVASFAGYGKLSGKKPDELLAGARVEVGEAKRDPRDFALWKAAADGDVAWDSPWGRGRPGWHIECSAMSLACLGAHFDIHGGGPDLRFPHHENEIAQSEAANGCDFVNTWMHAGAVRVDGEKMSKSLGNFFTIREILARHHAETVRYVLVNSHYRSAINYSLESLDNARAALVRLYTALQGVELPPVRTLAELDGDDRHVQRFRAAMDDDFNTPLALAVLFDLARTLNLARREGSQAEVERLAMLLRSLASVLGLLGEEPQAFLQAGEAGPSAEEIEALIEERLRAKGEGDYGRADGIRAQLAAQGVVLKDGREGTTWERG